MRGTPADRHTGQGTDPAAQDRRTLPGRRPVQGNTPASDDVVTVALETFDTAPTC